MVILDMVVAEGEGTKLLKRIFNYDVATDFIIDHFKDVQDLQAADVLGELRGLEVGKGLALRYKEGNFSEVERNSPLSDDDFSVSHVEVES